MDTQSLEEILSRIARTLMKVEPKDNCANYIEQFRDKLLESKEFSNNWLSSIYQLLSFSELPMDKRLRGMMYVIEYRLKCKISVNRCYAKPEMKKFDYEKSKLKELKSQYKELTGEARWTQKQLL